MGNIEQIRKAAMENPVATAAIFDRAEIYSAIEKMAEELKQVSETMFQARVRVQNSELGRQIMKAYSLAPKAKAPVPVQKVSVAELRKSMPNGGGDVIAQIDKIAADIARDEKVTMVKARDQAWQRNPKLLAMYNAAKGIAADAPPNRRRALLRANGAQLQRRDQGAAPPRRAPGHR